MFTCNKPFGSFDRPQKSFGFVGVNCVLNILLVGYNFQVIQLIVSTIKIFVVYFQTVFNRAVKRFPYHSVHTAFGIFSVFAQTSYPIAFKQMNFYWAVRRITRPSFTLLDRVRSGYTCAQKISNLLKGSAMLKHLFSFGNFGGVKCFASGNSSYAPKITYLVQIFKIQNWLPRFHTYAPFKLNRSIT